MTPYSVRSSRPGSILPGRIENPAYTCSISLTGFSIRPAQHAGLLEDTALSQAFSHVRERASYRFVDPVSNRSGTVLAVGVRAVDLVSARAIIVLVVALAAAAAFWHRRR